MDSEESLPIILVSATDVPTADKFISELIGEEEVVGAVGSAGAELRVWQLHNKYYRARVALAPHAPHAPHAPRAGGAPHAPLPPAWLPRVDAHLVLLAPHETESGACLQRRVAALGGVQARVRLALAECAGGGEGGWAAAARALRYEPVPLLAGAGEEGENEEEGEAGPCGTERVREALHAHTWRSLRLHAEGPPRSPHSLGSSSDTSGSRSSGEEGEGEEGEWSEWQSAELTRRRADQFAAALSALAGGGGGGGGRELRLLRAEALLAALAAPPRRPPPPPPPPPAS